MFSCFSSSISTDDAVIAYPYKPKSRYRRGQEDCTKYPYQERTHVLYPAHKHSIPSNEGQETSAESNEEPEDKNKDKQLVETGNPSSVVVPVTDKTGTNMLNLSLLKDSTNSSLQTLPNPDSQYLNKENGSSESLLDMFHSAKTINEYYYDKRYSFYHIAVVNDPVKTLSVYEPLRDGTCTNGSYRPATVMETANNKQCILAVNAGMFDTKTGACYGK